MNKGLLHMAIAAHIDTNLHRHYSKIADLYEVQQLEQKQIQKVAQVVDYVAPPEVYQSFSPPLSRKERRAIERKNKKKRP